VKLSHRIVLGSALLLLCAGIAFSQLPQGAPAAAGRGALGPRVVSPEILSDNKSLSVCWLRKLPMCSSMAIGRASAERR
jgi:hypothetical protein